MHANGIWPYDRVYAAACPKPCERKSPRQERSPANEAPVGGSQKGVKAQKPIAHIPQIFCRSSLCSHVRCLSERLKVSPTKINRAAEASDNGTWARSIRDDRSPSCGNKPAKGRFETPGAPSGD